MNENSWCFGIIGLNTELKDISLSDVAYIRPVIEPPGEIELAGACKDSSIFGAVARYARHVTHELVIDRSKDPGGLSFTMAWIIISCLRIKTKADILIPIVAEKSWSVISAIQGQSCDIRLIEDVPRPYKFSEQVSLTKSDIDWMQVNFGSMSGLLENQKFNYAVMAFGDHGHHANLRMSCAALWSGIEALFGVESELRFRLSAYVAAFLKTEGADRLSFYKSFKKLYDFRSKAVHGVDLSDDDIMAHIKLVRNILADCLEKIIENKSVPSQEDLDQKLFFHD